MRHLIDTLEPRTLLSAAVGRSALPPMPAAPKLAAAVMSINEIALSWKSPAGATIDIEQRINGKKSNGAWQVIAQADAGLLRYLDTSVSPSTHYSYRVRAVTASGTSKYSRIITTATTSLDSRAPQNLQVTTLPGAQVQLDWTNTTVSNAGVQISRSTNGVNFTNIATVPTGVSTYTDAGLDYSTLYFYRVKTKLGSRLSASSNIAFATTVPAPANLIAQPLSSSDIQLTWANASVTTTTGFTLLRSTDGVNYSIIAVFPGNLPAYTDVDSQLTPSTAYYYQLTATNSGGNSSPVPASTTTLPLIAASNVTATAASPYQVNVSWTDSAYPGTRINIQRSTDGVTFTTVATIAPGTGVYHDTGLSAVSTYIYRIFSQDAASNAVLSPTASVTTPPVLTPGSGWSAETTSTAAVATAATSLTVASATGFSAGQTLILENEPVTIQSISGTTLTLAAPGTAFAHNTAVPVFLPDPNNPSLTHSAPGQVAYNETAIANWDVVPYQTFDSTFNVGVVAFHATGIKAVSFSVNNGPWIAVTQSSINPQTANTTPVGQPSPGTNEYWLALDAAKFPADGQVEVRAIAYPNNGVPRALAPLYLSANAHHSLPSMSLYVAPSGSDTTGDGSPANPFATIARAANYWVFKNGTNTPIDGTNIYLEPGTYQLSSTAFYYPNTSTRWLNVTPAPGVDISQVLITGWGDPNTDNGWGLRTSLMHFEHITFAPQNWLDQSLFRTTQGTHSSLWVDGCILDGPGAGVDAGWTTNAIFNTYVTNTSESNCRDGLAGTLVRNVSVSHIGSDAFSSSHMVINSSVFASGSVDSGFHPDVYQFYNPGTTADDVILYGVTADLGGEYSGQGFFAGTGVAIKDVAFVNCNINNQDPALGGYNQAPVFQFGGPTQNLYVLSSTFTGLSFWRTDFAFVATDVVVDSSNFSSPINPTPLTGVTIR